MSSYISLHISSFISLSIHISGCISLSIHISSFHYQFTYQAAYQYQFTYQAAYHYQFTYQSANIYLHIKIAKHSQKSHHIPTFQTNFSKCSDIFSTTSSNKRFDAIALAFPMAFLAPRTSLRPSLPFLLNITCRCW